MNDTDTGYTAVQETQPLPRDVNPTENVDGIFITWALLYVLWSGLTQHHIKTFIGKRQ